MAKAAAPARGPQVHLPSDGSAILVRAEHVEDQCAYLRPPGERCARRTARLRLRRDSRDMDRFPQAGSWPQRLGFRLSIRSRLIRWREFDRNIHRDRRYGGAPIVSAELGWLGECVLEKSVDHTNSRAATEQFVFQLYGSDKSQHSPSRHTAFSSVRY